MKRMMQAALAALVLGICSCTAASLQVRQSQPAGYGYGGGEHNGGYSGGSSGGTTSWVEDVCEAPTQKVMAPSCYLVLWAFPVCVYGASFNQECHRVTHTRFETPTFYYRRSLP